VSVRNGTVRRVRSPAIEAGAEGGGDVASDLTLTTAGVSPAGKRVAVVGGTGGLGRAMSRVLARGGAEVTVVGRTFRDADVPGLSFVQADLETVAAARRTAEALNAEQLDLLVLTTGIFAGPVREVTVEGIERDMALSYLCRFVLLRAVAERLGTARPGRPRVFVMGYPGNGQAGAPEDLNAERSYGSFAQHMNTVAANEALVLDGATRYPRFGVFGINPGLVKTDIRANALGGNQSLRFRLTEMVIGWFTPTPERFAERMVPALLAPELESRTGILLDRKARPLAPTAALTPDRVAAFMAASEALVAKVPAA
jgi:NAD(P)-dependent dehydrogenase (short-subunit alcohol dehydrogenase family)